MRRAKSIGLNRALVEALARNVDNHRAEVHRWRRYPQISSSSNKSAIKNRPICGHLCNLRTAKWWKCELRRVAHGGIRPSRVLQSARCSLQFSTAGQASRRTQRRSEREMMSFFTFFGLFIAALFFWKAGAALTRGRIDVGWAFEPLVAHRDKERFMYWYMLIGSVLMGTCGIAMAVYTVIFPAS